MVQKRMAKKGAEKKWKGKDWFSVSAPEWLGGSVIASTPATDAKAVSGRVFEVSVPEVMGDQSKYYMRINLKTGVPSEGFVPTRFHSFYCVNEYVMRLGRKGLGKVAVFNDCVTKDGWKLQVSTVAVLNRRSNASIKAKVNGIVEEVMTTKAKDMNHNDFIKAVVAGVFQVKIKKTASKIYPVRLVEVTKIETLKAA